MPGGGWEECNDALGRWVDRWVWRRPSVLMLRASCCLAMAGYEPGIRKGPVYVRE